MFQHTLVLICYKFWQDQYNQILGCSPWSKDKSPSYIFLSSLFMWSNSVIQSGEVRTGQLSDQSPEAMMGDKENSKSHDGDCSCSVKALLFLTLPLSQLHAPIGGTSIMLLQLPSWLFWCLPPYIMNIHCSSLFKIWLRIGSINVTPYYFVNLIPQYNFSLQTCSLSHSSNFLIMIFHVPLSDFFHDYFEHSFLSCIFSWSSEIL